jgi:hypothetical protein
MPSNMRHNQRCGDNIGYTPLVPAGKGGIVMPVRDRHLRAPWGLVFACLFIAGYYAFLLYAFYRNGLYGLTPPEIYIQNTPDFPFDSNVGFFLVIAALLVHGAVRLFFPFVALGGIIFVCARWWQLRWAGRAVWLVIVLCAASTSIITWTMLGRSLAAWIFD